MDIKKDMLYSYYRIRKIIGFLGIALPILIYAFHGELLSSISHYYYSRSAVFFIAILSTFGLLLISYKGYEKDKDTEIFSDNLITHIGGIAALLVVLLPTTCNGSNSAEITDMCQQNYPLFGHDNTIVWIIHLISAGVFLFIMGYMSLFRFTKGKITDEKKTKNRIYRICGITVWVSIGILGIESIFQNFHFSEYDVFIFETISVVAFGIAWLVKGEAIKDIIDLKNKLF
jgi:hypothetical protein